MAQKVTIGGNRLGAGSQRKVSLSNYPRSTFNITREWRSTMAPGLLTPCFKDIVLPDDTWRINIKNKIFTIPTKGPVFGSCKYEIHFFFAPFRLYNGATHNNAIGIGQQMNTVKFPKIRFKKGKSMEAIAYNEIPETEFSPSSLNAYLGIRTLPPIGTSVTTKGVNWDLFGAMHIMYYDIFKNSYSNKQETTAYVMAPNTTAPNITSITYAEPTRRGTGTTQPIQYVNGEFANIGTENSVSILYLYCSGQTWNGPLEAHPLIKIKGTNIDPTAIWFQMVSYPLNGYNSTYTPILGSKVRLSDLILGGGVQDGDGTVYTINPNTSYAKTITNVWIADPTSTDGSGTYLYKIQAKVLIFKSEYTVSEINSETEMKGFPLTNIDDMRRTILANNTGEGVIITNEAGQADTFNELPYSINCAQINGEGSEYLAKKNLTGLMCKTYGADLFNAWLNDTYVTGAGGIAGKSNISITNNTLTMNSLLMAEKMFNLYTDITLAGGTYKDWRSAMWGVKPTAGIETPIFIGGYSSEIIFDEVVSNAESGEGETTKPLGSLAGRGTLFDGNKKGGHINFRSNEEGMILGIVSITPRIDYAQGNAWWVERLQNFQNLHTPALDGIGFEDLMENQMLGSAGQVIGNSVGATNNDLAVGKIPAWSNYQTAYNEVYGNFATNENQNFMVLTRDYEPIINNWAIEIGDPTMYVNPKKINKIFADTEIDAQNFWVQIKFEATARRRMSSNLIPRF